MPTALVLIIRPAAAGDVQPDLARAAHAAVLRLIATANADLAARLHDDDGPKPLTVSNLIGLTPRGRVAAVTPDRTYWLRLTLLTPELEALVEGWTPEAIGVLDLDGTAWRVEALAADEATHPWAGRASYEGLAAPALLRAAGGPTRWTLEFAAPVTFRQRGLTMPLPLPDLVFGSLLDRWNAFAPLALPEEVRRFAAECVAVSRFELRSQAPLGKGGAPQIGAVGRCTYTAVNRDRYWLACVETLARFALYGGVGAGTARGFGQVRLLEEQGRHQGQTAPFAEPPS
ncbi:MAG TPA: CRISPR system precrRNA processing endoribonuclease RAMP protein Cas6 [Roseiflexaceae bacterium]|nr:CRISPR system precrRNA processing endoribonuclease RAMP protein Cas6 [Roseiflexaceae bacterium]